MDDAPQPLPPADSHLPHASRAPDPFPRERFTALVRRLPRYARLAWTLSRHPKVRGKQRAVLAAAAVYLLSPVDLVPGFIPVVGQLDDAAAILIGLGMALRSLTPEDRAAALASANLEAGDLDADLRTIGASYAWMGRQGLRLGRQAVGVTVRGARSLTGTVASRIRRARGGGAD